MKNNAVEKIISDDNFLERILKATKNDEIKLVFKENGIELTDKQLENLKNTFKSRLSKLDKIELENISGGINKEKLGWATLKGAGEYGRGGLWAGAILGATAGIVDTTIKAKKGKISTSFEFLKEVLKTSIMASTIATMGGAISGSMASATSEIIAQK